MDDQQNDLLEIVQKAIDLFRENDGYLIENDLSERCICARFAICLTAALENTLYSSYSVDVEYNRGMDGKERALKRIDDKPITVDLIVHKRGYDCYYGFDNLICIEMKKTTNPIGCEHDEERLRKMTDNAYGFCYKLGVMLLIDMDANNIFVHSTWKGN